MKRLRVILIILLLGAIVNVAVAWVIALTLTLDDATRGVVIGTSVIGNESWELDALDPPVMRQLIQDEVDTLRDDEIWAVDLELLAEQRRTLQATSAQWDRIMSEL